MTGRCRWFLKAQRVKGDGEVETEPSSDRQNEKKDNNGPLDKNVNDVEMKMKRLEEEKELAQTFQRWEKKVGKKWLAKRDEMKADVKDLMETKEKPEQHWKRKVKGEKKRAKVGRKPLQSERMPRRPGRIKREAKAQSREQQ